MLKFTGDIKQLEENGYHPNVYETYYFKTLSRYGGIFINMKTKEIEIEEMDSRAVQLELSKISYTED